MSEVNKTIARRYFEEILNQHNLALVDELFTEDSVVRVLHMPEVRGLEARRQFVARLHAVSHDGHYTIEDLIAEGENVVVRWTWAGTHQGEWMGIAPTGKRASLRGTTTMQVGGGKIIEEYTDWDALGYLQQVGAVPPMGESKSPPTAQPGQQDIARESAFQAAKAAFSMYGGFFKDVAAEVGMEKAVSLHAKQGEVTGAMLAGMTKQRLADKEFDMKTFASVLSNAYQVFGFTFEIGESAASLRLSCTRCPVYEGFKSAGLDHATAELLCSRMATAEINEEKKLCPILSASLKFRATPDEACVEEFALAK